MNVTCQYITFLIVLLILFIIHISKDTFVDYIDPQTVELHSSLVDTKKGRDLKIQQQYLTQIFKEFVDICNYYNIGYVAIGGTLIGAIRHKGWIPWDDDIDVALFKKDLDQIIKIYQTDPYLVKKYKITKGNNNVWADYKKVRLRAHPKIFLDLFLLKKSIFNNKFTLVSYPKEVLSFIDRSNRYVYKDDIIPYKRAQFEEITINIPNNPVRFLERIDGYSNVGKLPPVSQRKIRHGVTTFVTTLPVCDIDYTFYET